MTRLLPGLAAFVAAMLVALLGLYAQAGTPEPREAPPPGVVKESRGGVVKLRLLGVNDFHGHLEPPRPGIGGAAWLKSHLDRATLPGRTIRVHAGDMVGATPLISSWFHDEPTIEAANEIGFDVGTLGNHEFDEGGEELMRLLRGGRRAGPEALKPDVTGQPVNTSSPEFAGADFPYIAANTRRPRRRAAPAAIPDRRASGRAGRLHRRDHALHADLPARPARRALSLHGHLRGGEPMGAGAAPPRRGGDRGPGPRRRADAGRSRTRRTTSARSSTRHAR